MTALTTTDIAAGWLMISAVLVAAGVGVIWFVRSEWAERRAERDAADAEDARLALEFFARLRKYIDEEEVDWAEFLGTVHTDHAPLASVTPLPSKPRVIRMPQQRDGSVS